MFCSISQHTTRGSTSLEVRRSEPGPRAGVGVEKRGLFRGYPVVRVLFNWIEGRKEIYGYGQSGAHQGIQACARHPCAGRNRDAAERDHAVGGAAGHHGQLRGDRRHRAMAHHRLHAHHGGRDPHHRVYYRAAHHPASLYHRLRALPGRHPGGGPRPRLPGAAGRPGAAGCRNCADYAPAHDHRHECGAP